MIRQWHVLISGFRQSIDEQTGMSRLWLKMRPHSSATTCVQLYPWKADWKEIAGFIRTNSVGNPQVSICAYSWGAGHGFVSLANHLASHGIRVQRAVLCDPVYRNPYLPVWFNLAPRSLWGRRTITVPPNVARVDWFYQRQDKPSGHPPRATGRTLITDGVELDLPHAGMEDSPEFHQAVLRQ